MRAPSLNLNPYPHTQDAPTIEMFLRLLAVCHTVIPDGDTSSEKGIKCEG